MKHTPQQRVVRAWAITEAGTLLKYHFSYDGEVTYMVFPTFKDANVFRGATKNMEIVRAELHLSPLPKQKAKKKTKA
jgi:hypothetical protein